MKQNNYDKNIDELINKYIESTQAEATLKGFLYQILVTLYMWLEINKQENVYEIYPEYKDDICIILTNKKQHIQAKAYDSGDFTLNKSAFLNTIFNFYVSYYKEKSKEHISFLFYTNAKPGVQQEDLFKKWSNNNLSSLDKNSIYIKMEKNLLENLEKKLKIKIENKEFIRTLKDNWNNFIDSIKLQFNYKSVDEDIDNLRISILHNIDKLNYSIDKDVIFHRLLMEVLEKSIKKTKEDKKINEELLINVLNDSEENIIMEMKDKFESISEQIKNSEKNIIDTINNMNRDKNLNIITIRSRECIENSPFQLNLSEFFIKSTSDNYRKIKKERYWNNEIIDNIEKFFINIKKNINGELYLDLINTHTSLAFFVGYRYLKQFCDIMYFKKGEKIYIPKNNYSINERWARDKEKINKGDEINIIITTTMNPKNIKTVVKNFTIKQNMNTDSLTTYYLKNDNTIVTSKASITESNILLLVRDVSDDILGELIDKKINLFLSCPNEFAYLLGRELDKYKNITLYEIEEYGSSNYVKTLDINYINNKLQR